MQKIFNFAFLYLTPEITVQINFPSAALFTYSFLKPVLTYKAESAGTEME